mmetsp:Transcript_38460/g.126937  ORF Transcript_38460/g.126937 Transcript_38460/m.126937 type:complete len:209 (-) Transcript_38460:499-1125(-)
MRCEQVRGEGRPSYLPYFDNCACLRTRLRTRKQSIRRCVFILWVGHIHSGTDHDWSQHGSTPHPRPAPVPACGTGGSSSSSSSSHSALSSSSKSQAAQMPLSRYSYTTAPSRTATSPPSCVRQRSSVGCSSSQLARLTPSIVCSRSVASSSGLLPQPPTRGSSSKAERRTFPSPSRSRMMPLKVGRPALWPCASAASIHSCLPPGLPR